MSRVPFLCANVTRHFRSHDRLVYNVTLSQTTGSNRSPARPQPGAMRSSSPDHERRGSMTRPNCAKHHETCQDTSPTCHTGTLLTTRVGFAVHKSSTCRFVPSGCVCPRDHERPLSHPSTASASPKCVTRARLRHQCPRDHERPFSHQSTASASTTCFTRARLSTGCVTSARATMNVPGAIRAQPQRRQHASLEPGCVTNARATMNVP